MSNPVDSALDELRAAYFDVPAGDPSADQLLDSMPRLLQAARAVLDVSGRICPVCSGYHTSPTDAQQEDLAAILRALGLGDHARPYSSHQVVHEEVLPALRAFKEQPR